MRDCYSILRDHGAPDVVGKMKQFATYVEFRALGEIMPIKRLPDQRFITA